MNYEEILNTRENTVAHKEQMLYGVYFKKRIDGKYRNVIELKPELADSLVFCEGLRQDKETNQRIRDSFQLHYNLNEDSSGIFGIELQEMGNFQTLAQLLSDTPAVVTEKGFLDGTIDALMTAAEKLNAKGIFHLCFSPKDIFMRKSDRNPMLLCHGSSFRNMSDQASFYSGYEDMVAPEVLSGQPVDARSDIYALGCFIKKLYEYGDMPMEYKQIVKNATAQDPAQRYQSIAEMRSALSNKKNFKRSLIMLGAAVAIVLLCIFIFIDLMPQSSNVEFIDDNGLRSVDYYAEDPLASDTFSYDPREYLDPDQQEYLDSLGTMSDAELNALLDSIGPIANAQEIFRRQFTPQVERIMAELYSRQQMGSSQNSFIAHSQQAIDQLMESAKQIGEQCDLSDDQISELADQIISHIQTERQRQVTRYGSMTQSGEE